MTNWKIKIQDRVAMLLVDIYVYADTPDGVMVWTTDPEKNTVKEKHYERTCFDIKPSFTIPRGLLEPLLQTLIEKGIKPQQQSFVEGKLQATESHLSDLRQLLKLKK